MLDSTTGSWLWSTQIFPNFTNTFYDVWGIIILILLIINLAFAWIFEIKFLYLFEFAQTIILYIHCSVNINVNLKTFTSWFQVSKFDLRFLTIPRLIDLMGWKFESERMASIQFYCQTTFLNYFNLLMIVILILFTIFLLKLLSNRWKVSLYILKLINKRMNENKIWWIFIHWLLSLTLINLVNDITNLSKHALYSFISLIIFALIFIYLLVSKPSVLSLRFLAKIDSENQVSFTLISIIKSIVLTVIFNFEGLANLIIWASIEIILHLFIIGIHLYSFSKIILNHLCLF